MIKILIVDDDKNNRMILNLLLEDFLDEYKAHSFEIDEVENGKRAIENIQHKTYDIIFMDLIMPEMDGIEATKIIREHDKDVMIIAISAIEDNEAKDVILSHGAEDYISKPFNADIFHSRISNYVSLIESRRHKKFNAKAINGYSKQIYSRCIIFMITSEHALSEFWDYYLLNEAYHCEHLSDVIRVIYSLGEMLLKFDVHSEVIVEESESHHYFTLIKTDKLDATLIKLIMMKNESVSDYIIEKEKISFQLLKHATPPAELEIAQKSEDSSDVEVS
jgi:two-component system chemotaxis response regulator CheY